MPPKSLLLRGEQRARFGRRDMLAGLAAAAALLWPMNLAGATEPVSIGLNPLFLDSDIELLSLLQSYLAGRLGRSVQLLKRRTYREITALLLSGQLDAAWVCDDPYVQHEDQLALLAVPLYRHEPLYQTYVIVSEGSKAQSFDDIRVWILMTLGPRWTTGIIILPSAPLVSNGPYRIFSHPNYLVVVGEIVTLPLLLRRRLAQAKVGRGKMRSSY